MSPDAQLLDWFRAPEIYDGARHEASKVEATVESGNASEGPTLKPTLERVLQRYPHVRRPVVVADRGLLSLDNLQLWSSETALRWPAAFRRAAGARDRSGYTRFGSYPGAQL